MMDLDIGDKFLALCNNVAPARQAGKPQDSEACGRQAPKLNLWIIRLGQDRKSVCARHRETNGPSPRILDLHDRSRHRNLLIDGLLRHRRGHSEAMTAFVAAEKLAGQQAKALACGFSLLPTHGDLGDDESGLITG